MGLIVLIPLLLPESCRWLMSRGRTQQVLTILRRIARLNGRQVADSVYEAAERLCQVQTRFGVADGISTLLKPARPQLSYLDLFRQPDMRRYGGAVAFHDMVLAHGPGQDQPPGVPALDGDQLRVRHDRAEH